MRRPPRIAVLLTVFAAVAIWTIWMIQDEGTTVPTSPIAPAPPPLPAFVSAQPQGPVEPPWPDRFVGESVPVAPPLPYRFVGEIVLPTETWAFLARGDETFRVREGGTISGEYKVESVKADELVLLHLASGVHQTARLASPGGAIPGTGPQTVQAPADSAAVSKRDIFPYDPQAPADSAALAPSRGDARSVGPATFSAAPIEEPPVQRVPLPHRIRRRVETTDQPNFHSTY